MQKPQDINLFGVDMVVSVPGLEDYEKVKITRISDSGVTVNGAKCGNNVVLSGRTPAVLWKAEEKNEGISKEKENKIMTTENTNLNVVSEETSVRAKRGSIKAKMAALKVPEGQFTVAQFANLNSIPNGYANQWVKGNAKEVGNAPKVEGQRGRVAKLFEVK